MNYIHTETDQVLNLEVLCQLVEDIGFERVNVVTEMSILDLKKLFSNVSTAGQNSDWPALKIATHSLLGVSAIIGASKLRGLSQELEFNLEDRRFFLAAMLVADVLLAIMDYIQKIEGFRNLESPTAIFSRRDKYLNTTNPGLEFGSVDAVAIAS
jgi:HPt (histidine-containing phosphotransfer) domain-containing protein